MKKRVLVKVFLVPAVFVLLLSCMFFPAAAYADEDDLPVIIKWVDGAAVTDKLTPLNDTWAIDNSGLSDAKYVLIGQDGAEVFRVVNYPADIDAGKTLHAYSYPVDFTLTVPDGLTGEVVLTVESESAVFTVSLNEANNYKTIVSFFAGEYEVTDIEVTSDLNGVYDIPDAETLSVKGGTTMASWTLSKNEGASNVADNAGTNTTESEKQGTDVIGTIRSFDTDGDLLSDTIWLIVSVAVLFGIYGFIKYRRKKKEELDR